MGLIGVGSSRDSEARGVFNVGNSVVLTDGLVAGVSEVGWAGSLGVGGSPLSTTRGAGVFLSAGRTTSGEAVTERLGAVRPMITGETFSPSVLTAGSETIVDAGFGRASPWARFDSLSLMFVGERISFLELVGVADRVGGDGLTDETTGVLLNGELLKDLMSMRGLGGKLRPEAFEVALPGLRG